jgi:hypothetical protein
MKIMIIRRTRRMRSEIVELLRQEAHKAAAVDPQSHVNSAPQHPAIGATQVATSERSSGCCCGPA